MGAISNKSIKETLIRLLDTYKAVQQIAPREESNQASLYCINFSHISDFLCA